MLTLMLTMVIRKMCATNERKEKKNRDAAVVVEEKEVIAVKYLSAAAAALAEVLLQFEGLFQSAIVLPCSGVR